MVDPRDDEIIELIVREPSPLDETPAEHLMHVLHTLGYDVTKFGDYWDRSENPILDASGNPIVGKGHRE